MKHIVCLGDSITDAQRLFSPDGLGYGYVKILSDQMPDDVLITNRGVDGFTVPRLLENVERDCISKMPDLVTILIGINDVGLIMGEEGRPERQNAYVERFRMTYRQLVKQIVEGTDAPVILMEPFLFPCPEKYKNWFPYVKILSKEVKKISRDYQTAFLSLHEPLNSLASEIGMDAVTSDGIHLTEEGHGFLARLLRQKMKELQKH